MTHEPMAVLNAVLAWLEEQIDLDHRAEVEKRHRDAMYWRPTDHPPVGIGGIPLEQFPIYPYRETFDDPVKMMVNELVHPLYPEDPSVGSSVLLKDDFPLQIRANHGLGIIPSLFGAQYRIAGPEAGLSEGAMPWVVPLGGPENIVPLIDAGLPELDSSLLSRVLETMSFYREKLSEYPKCSQAIHITQPDLQGVMDNAHLLWGADLFVYLYEEPELIHSLMDLMAQTEIAMVKKLQPYTTEQASEDCVYLHWGVCRGSLLLKNDIPAMISAEMYAEFVRPYDEQVLRAFSGGGSIHLGGGGDHCLQELASTQNLGSVHLDPQSSTDTWYEALRERNIGLVDIVHPKEEIFSGQYKQRFPTGVSFVTEVSGLEEGQRLMEVIDR